MIDTFREGKAPEIIRQKGARGDLPVSPEEKIEILTFLAQYSDEAIRDTAFTTLQTWDSQELQQVLSNPETPSSVLDFVSTYLAHDRKDLAQALLQNYKVPADLRLLLQDIVSQPAAPESGSLSPQTTSPESPAAVAAPKPDPAANANSVAGKSDATKSDGEEKKEVKKQTLLEKLNAMSPSQKIKAALTGNMEERMVLIRDANKLVARAVLGSPKLTDQEIESFAAMKNVTEEVLRLIAMNRKFMKSYAVMKQLINNPRTPIDVGLPLLNRLNERDLKGVMLNKNIAETLRGMAHKIIKQKEEANKPKLPTGH